LALITSWASGDGSVVSRATSVNRPASIPSSTRFKPGSHRFEQAVREIPDHPLVQQTIADCLLEAMDFPGLKRVLEGMEAGRFTLVARDTTEPSRSPTR